MSLVNLSAILKDAQEKHYGVGAFNALGIGGIRGAIRAAEELNSPIILQQAEIHLPYFPIDFMAPVMIEAAKKAKVPVAVHFDHGLSFESVVKALQLGFSSVMFDGASLPLEENIVQTQALAKLAHAMGATCEAELGRVGGAEDGSEVIEMMLTDVKEAGLFAEKTKVDALAVAIGNAHGQYKEAPNLQFQRLKEIKDTVSCPLVLHGGSGISPEGFRECIRLGISKVNVGTALFNSAAQHVESLLSNSSKLDFFDMTTTMEDGVYSVVKEHIEIFMSDGKA